MLRLSDLILVCSKQELSGIPEGKVLINTINAHSYNVAQKDKVFAESLNPNVNENEDENEKYNEDENEKGGECRKYLIPDGASIVKACQWLKGKSQPKERIAGWDLFAFEMQRMNENQNENKKLSYEDENENGTAYENEDENENRKRKVMFMGSSEEVLEKIRQRAAVDYPNLEIVTYSPPYKAEFSDEDNTTIIKAINEAKPDLLWIGMTAPKQEKWTWQHWNELAIHCHVGTIGAVFDFYAGTAQRAPLWWQKHSLEWLYRLVKEPKRMWRRYVIGNPLFIFRIIKEKMTKKHDQTK